MVIRIEPKCTNNTPLTQKTIKDSIENYKLSQINHSQLQLGEHKKDKGKYLIKKIMNIIDESKIEQIDRESKILSLINHPKIIKLHSYFSESDAFNEKNQTHMLSKYLIYDYFSLTTLEKKLEEKQFDTKDALIIFLQVTKGIECLHSAQTKVIYRNFNLNDIYYYKKHIKLFNFLLSNYVSENDKRDTDTNGDVYFLAPEVKSEPNGSTYDEKVDLWSLGVLLYKLLTHEYPFDDKRTHNDEDVREKIQQGDIDWSNKLDSEAKQLITGLLKVDPNERFTIKEIYQHELFSLYDINPENDEIVNGEGDVDIEGWNENMLSGRNHFDSDQSSIGKRSNCFDSVESLDAKQLNEMIIEHNAYNNSNMMEYNEENEYYINKTINDSIGLKNKTNNSNNNHNDRNK